MTDHKYEQQFGLNGSLDEEIGRFADFTRDELDASVDEPPILPEGELALYHSSLQIRKVFYSGEWWSQSVDVIAALTETARPRKYWSDLKRQLSDKEGNSELSDKIGQLALPGSDGKAYPTDVANTETLLQIIQSVPSRRAEPFKRWLAKVGYERIQEIQNPEIAIRRAILMYQIQGYSDEWIEKRVRSIVVRKELTSEWRKRGVQEGKQYAILTNIISAETFGGVTVERHKGVKGLAKQHNLRDHMTDLELIFTMLGEKSTTEIARTRDAQGFYQNTKAASAGGIVAGTARRQLERETGQMVVSRSNYLGKQSRIADPERLTEKRGA